MAALIASGAQRLLKTLGSPSPVQADDHMAQRQFMR